MLVEVLDLRYMPNLVGSLNPAWSGQMPKLRELLLSGNTFTVKMRTRPWGSILVAKGPCQHAWLITCSKLAWLCAEAPSLCKRACSNGQ